MTGGTRAQDRLERLLHVLPAASRDGGVELSALAAELGTDERRIVQDLEQVTARIYYQPGGWPDDVVIRMEPDRVQVVRAPGFERPVRLSRDETLCLALALRAASASAHVADEGQRQALLDRAETHLASPDFEAHVGDAGSEEHQRSPTSAAAGHGAIATDGPDPDPEGIRRTLMTAARDRRPCALWYVKDGADDGSVRVVHPYAVAYGEGRWYAVAHCATEDDIRVFRMDRILAADVADGSFEVPEDFDVDAYVQDGRVYHASESTEVRVRYSERIARWIRERARWEEDRVEDAGDGGVIVRHDVADPRWAVGHALLYAPEAEVVEPEEVRELVREVVAGMAG